MTTIPLYQTDAYLKSFKANVLAVDDNKNAMVLDQSAIYPGGGGQPPDKGWLEMAGMRLDVTRIYRENGIAWHEIEGHLPIVGSKLDGFIDFDHRYRLMRTHTAMHILCGVIYREYGALVTGGNMEPLSGRMDFEFEHMSRELVNVIERMINEEVANAREIRVEILPREEANKIPDLIRTKINLLPAGLKEIRTVEIVGLDLQADGGTHVNNTREVGEIRISDYKSKGKINKRLKIELSE